MAAPNNSFRHLFSFGGADVKPIPVPVAPVAPDIPVTPPTRKRPRQFIEDEPPVQGGSGELSDPEDDPEQLLAVARNFSRKKDVASIRSDWFDGGRQERLRTDFRQNHRRHTKNYKSTATNAGEVDRKRN